MFRNMLFILSFTLLFSTIVLSGTPKTINFQGHLSNSSGDPVVDSTYSVTFDIYTDPLAPEGEGLVSLWDETRDVTTTGGQFSIILGTVNPIPDSAFNNPSRYLVVTIDGEAMEPPSKLTSVPYASHAHNSDNLNNEPPGYYLDWDNLINVPADIADGDDTAVGGGDITAVIAGTDLSGGGTSGDVTLELANDINNNHNFNGARYEFNGGRVHFEDSTMEVSNDQINIGSTLSLPNSLVSIRRTYDNTDENRYLSISGKNLSTGKTIGLRSIVYNDGGDERYAGYFEALPNNWSLLTGDSYGVYAAGYGGNNAYGVYGYASVGVTNWAGYFSGDVHVTGTLSKGGGSFKIDHPLDPENKYLQHSFVESPDMMNIYNGNIITDANGFATVKLPDYFDALNRDFRYQLTVIGEFAQAIVSEKIHNRRFIIRTDKPNIEVSWMVTGIRHDKWANQNRIQVESKKPLDKIGTYMHSNAYGMPIEKDSNFEQIKSNPDLKNELQDK